MLNHNQDLFLIVSACLASLQKFLKGKSDAYALVPQAMAQFVLKIEKLSHIMGPTPILEMVRLRFPSPIMAPVIGHYRVPLSLCFKASLSAKPFL